MKKFIYNLIISLVTSTSPVIAQNGNISDDITAPQTLADVEMSKELQNELSSRNTAMVDQPVAWYHASYGYYGQYTTGADQFITRYDMEGNYVATLSKRDWNDNAPASLKNAFNKSIYKPQQVIGYWEITDPDKKGYYLELTNEKGHPKRLWADDQNKFYTSPPTL